MTNGRLSASNPGRLRSRSTVFAVALLATTAARAFAQPANSCTLQLGLGYVAAESVAQPGDVVRTRLTLGTADLQGATTLTVQALRFFLQCKASASRLLPCVQDGAVVAYGGDETITTTCEGVAWSTGHGVYPRPNQVVFTPSVPLDIPANTPAFCELEFDVRILGRSSDTTPGVAEQVAGLGFGRNDASCDNGLRAVAAVTGGVHICPDCD